VIRECNGLGRKKESHHLQEIIALDGDPLKDITALCRVVFVMKGGVVYKNDVKATGG
jgi:hypothetical protein